MSTLPLVSVIVPVYKVEGYLEKCVDSLLSQTYRQLEIILVNDGSPDNCGRICDAYGEKDSRVRVIHKSNGGLSDARNAGLDICTGEYITFADSDDYADSRLIETLVRGVTEYPARVSACGFYTVRQGKAVPWRTPAEEYRVLPSAEAVADMMYTESIDTSAWGKLFHRSCFDGIRFPKGHIYEEVKTTYRLMLKAEKVSIILQPLYYYVKHGDSIVTSRFSAKHMDMLKHSEEMLAYAEEENPVLIDAARRRVVYACFYLLKTMGGSWKQFPEEVKTLRKKLKKYGKSVFTDGRTPKRDKLALIFVQLGIGFFQKMWSLYCVLTGRERAE